MELTRLQKMSAAAFRDLIREVEPHERAPLLRERFRIHYDEFCKYCWPERFTLEFNALHEDLFERERVRPWGERLALSLTVRDCTAAPRGFAKSTVTSFAAPAHDIVYDNEAYILLASAGHRLSVAMSRDLRHQFLAKDTPFERLYGPFTVTGGVEEWEVSVRGRPPVAILPVSAGGEVRGARHPTRGIRPTKVILDDGEKKDRVRNPEQRALWWAWLTKDVLKLADRRGGTVFRVVGTVLHPESGLSQLLADAGWRSKRWQAILKWPEHTDLWEKCRAIWANLTLGTYRREAAAAFFKAHRAAMEEGSELLDPQSKSLFDLYEMIWSEGYAAFLQEMQNDPVDPTAQIFHSPAFTRFTVDAGEIVTATGRRVRLRDLRIAGRWDPATGAAHGDYAAIAILGRDKFGYTYVLDVWMRRAKVSEQLAAAWTLAERWGCHRMTVESNGFQQLVAEPFPRERKARKEAGQFHKLELRPEPSTEDKELRIATLEPDTTNGWLQFNRALPHEVLAQFDQFPTADHDDAPDAIHAAWKELGGRPVEMAQ